MTRNQTQNQTSSSPPLGGRFWLALALGISLGANGVLWMSPPESKAAYGQDSGSSNGYIMTSFVMQGKGQAEGLAILDTNAKRLWTGYESGNGFQLYSIRDISYDLVPQSYSAKGKQKPSVEEMKKGGRNK
ncbi:MAG: hypothetical protein OSB12_07535 [Planctomycetota bacterium]|jgi:hypothetical protein|nr:hypothetical protein [Planctomycetota bacterium]